MQTVVVWGAASGLGAAMVEQLHQQGYQVIAVARNPQRNERLKALDVKSIECDATEKAQISAVMKQVPEEAAHISSMGSFMADIPVDYIGHRHLIDALEQNQTKRFILITSLGCGDSWQFLSQRAKEGFGAVVREKSLAETWLVSSKLNYTILRPGGLKDGEANGSAQLSQGKEVHGLIYRQELARVVANLLADPGSYGQIYECVDPSITYNS